jgi:hypothetical protein
MNEDEELKRLIASIDEVDYAALMRSVSEVDTEALIASIDEVDISALIQALEESENELLKHYGLKETRKKAPESPK